MPSPFLLNRGTIPQVLAKHQEQLQAFFYGLMEDVTQPDVSWPQLVERVAQRLTGLRALIDGEIGPRIRGPMEFVELLSFLSPPPPM